MKLILLRDRENVLYIASVDSDNTYTINESISILYDCQKIETRAISRVFEGNMTDFIPAFQPAAIDPKGLLPCPFCGLTQLTIGISYEISGDPDGHDNYCVCCDYTKGGCGACSGVCETETEAIRRWNQRVKR